MRLTLLATLLLTAACDDDFALPPAPADTVANVLALSGTASVGESLYTNRCFACHNPNAANPIGPDLGDGGVASMDDEELLSVIIDGRNAMPKFRGWDEQEYADLLAYLRSAYGGPEEVDDTGDMDTGDTGDMDTGDTGTMDTGDADTGA